MRQKLSGAILLFFALSAQSFADQATTDLSSILQPRENESQVQSDLSNGTSKMFGYDILQDSVIQKIFGEISADDNNISVLESAYDNLKAQNGDLTKQIKKFSMTPEACELDELKNVEASAAETESIRFNCVRQYILLEMPTASSLATTAFSDATLSYHPTMNSFPVTQQYVQVTFTNTSSQQIIAADVFVETKAKPNTFKVFRIYPDLPIDPNAVATLSGASLLNLDPSQNFGDVYQWGFVAVWAVNNN